MAIFIANNIIKITMEQNSLATIPDIKNKILTVRGIQVMVDRDLAFLYKVETRTLNQAVKRNVHRFPENFCFHINKTELKSLRSQIVISNNRGGRRYSPYFFTEEGVAMLSAVLKSDIAIYMSIRIMTAFVEMRKIINTNAQLLTRIDVVEQKQIEHKIETDKKFDQIFDALASKENPPKQKIFFNGQMFDAYNFVSSLIRQAKKKIVLIDNFIDETVLTLLNKRRRNVGITVYCRKITPQIKLDLEKFNSQYPKIEIKEFKLSHDRFLIIDGRDIYHFGASIKDLGKKWFAFSKFDNEALEILGKLK